MVCDSSGLTDAPEPIALPDGRRVCEACWRDITLTVAMLADEPLVVDDRVLWGPRDEQ